MAAVSCKAQSVSSHAIHHLSALPCGFYNQPPECLCNPVFLEKRRNTWSTQ